MRISLGGILIIGDNNNKSKLKYEMYKLKGTAIKNKKNNLDTYKSRKAYPFCFFCIEIWCKMDDLVIILI